MSLRIVITGGSGFIGRQLLAGLGKIHEVCAPPSGDLDLLDGEGVEAFLARHLPDVVIHAATWNATAVSPKDTSLVLDDNLRMFANLVHARGQFGRLIHFGSGAEFDRAHWRGDLSEDDLGRHIPADAYGFRKFWIAQQTEHLPFALNLRLFAVFGPGEDWRIRFPSRTACRVLHGLPATLRQDRRFDYLQVGDVVRAVAACLDNPGLQGSLNLCRGETTLLSALAVKIAEAAGVPLDLRIATPGEAPAYGGSNARFRSLVPSWEPSPLDEGLRGLVEWYRARLQEIPKEALQAAGA